MPNVVGLYQLECQSAYLGDGAQEFIRAIRRWASERETVSDALELTVIAPQNGTGAATVVSTQATRLYGVLIDSGASSGFLTLYNLTAATVGASAVNLAIPFATNQTKGVLFLSEDYDNANEFATGICAGTLTTVAGTTALGTAVNGVWFLTDAVP